MTEADYTRRHVQVAWAVHAFTACGVIAGYLGLNAVNEGRSQDAILWLVVALILDGIDGPIARKIEIRRRVPVVDGHTLDAIVDYFTCSIVPVAFLDRFDLLPENTTAVVSFGILAGSALWLARTDQETADGWFRGFPGEWNMIIPTLFLLGAHPWVNLMVCGVLCVLQLSKVQFPHPLSVRHQRGISVAFIVAWLGSMVWLAIAERDPVAVRIVLLVAPMWTVLQVIRRALRHRTTNTSGLARAGSR